jgi:oligosaccharide repeat unit polymerase
VVRRFRQGAGRVQDEGVLIAPRLSNEHRCDAGLPRDTVPYLTHVASADVRLPVARGKGRNETSVHWGPAKLTLLLTSLIVVAYALVMISTAETAREGWALHVSLVSLIWLGVYVSCTWWQFRTPYLLTTCYVITLVLFHLGITIPEAFGIFGDAGTAPVLSSKRLELSGWCTVLALESLGVGFSIALKRHHFLIARHIVERQTANRALALLYSKGIGLLLASGIFLGLAIASFGNLLNYSRVDFFRGVGDTRGLGVFLMCFPSALVALVIGATTRTTRLFSAVIAGLGIVLILLSGYRSAATFPLLVGIVMWVKTGRRIPTIIAIGSLALILVAISATGILRVYAYKDMNSDALAKSVQQATVQDALFNMGSTGGVLAEVIRLVPKVDPYRYGQSYLLCISSAIPNVLPGQSESPRARAKRRAITEGDVYTSLIPSDWLTYRLAPDKFAVGEGVGFTGIGEPYLNFGYPGIVAFFAALGFFFARIESAILIRRPWLLVFCCTMLWPLITTVRQDFGSFIQPASFVLYVILHGAC